MKRAGLLGIVLAVMVGVGCSIEDEQPQPISSKRFVGFDVKPGPVARGFSNYVRAGSADVTVAEFVFTSLLTEEKVWVKQTKLCFGGDLSLALDDHAFFKIFLGDRKIWEGYLHFGNNAYNMSCMWSTSPPDLFVLNPGELLLLRYVADFDATSTGRLNINFDGRGSSDSYGVTESGEHTLAPDLYIFTQGVVVY